MSTRTNRRWWLAVGVVALGCFGLVVGLWLMSPASEQGGGASDPTAAVGAIPDPAATGELVADAPATEAAAGSSGQRVAPIAKPSDHEDERSNYSSEAVTVDNGPQATAEFRRAEAALEQATDGVHACVREAAAEHRRLRRHGDVDPMLCVYQHTAFPHEQGAVRFEIVTLNGYSYYVDASGKRLRYSEYDGNACRSIDHQSGCDSWGG